MPFLGNTPSQGFTNSVTKDDFTPNGSTTAFTLSKASNTNNIEVYVGNVRQEPTSSYSVSGTTLTMTEAPATGTNFYVMHESGSSAISLTPAAGTSVPGAFGVSGALTAGSAGVTGNTTVGGTLVNTGLITASAGVAIGGTGSANTLDDYEEGTWTPVIKGVGGNPTITYQSGGQQGYYTKIGNMIYCSFIVAIAGGGYSGGSGDVFIEAPFTSANHDLSAAAFAVNRMTNEVDLSGSRTDLSFSMAGNNNQMRLTQFGGNLGTTQWTNGVSTGQISAGSEFA